MKVYETGEIRNVAVVGHSGSGKTTLIERLLFQTGATSRMGSVVQGTTLMDFEEEEIRRQSSISTSVAWFERNGVKVNLLDTPGYLDFIGEVNTALDVCDGALVLVEALSGVEVGTEVAWRRILDRKMPRVIVVNRMNRENVRLRRVKEGLEEHFGDNLVQLQIPLGEGPDFRGVIDLLAMECRLGDNDRREPIPDELKEEADAARLAVVEAAALGDDALMEKYFEEDWLDDKDVVRGLRLAMQKGEIVPVLYSAPEIGYAVLPVLGALTRLMPSPDVVEPTVAEQLDGDLVDVVCASDGPLAAFVFKNRDDQYGKTSYIKVCSGQLSSDSRVFDMGKGQEIRVS
ncbi:MAG: GTP-binding protein, partial [Chloroflexota bacterium]